MLYFNCDYNNGCHPEVMKRLCETNNEFTDVYNQDVYTASAIEKIKKACDCPNAKVYFLGGGTQTNSTVIASYLREYQGVVAAESGHVNQHESGAIEYTGHKVMSIPQHEGKIWAKELKSYIETYYSDANYEHMVFPGMVYISYPTELGTLYTKQELKELHDVCCQFGLPLFLDGARLGYGLTSKSCDLTFPELASLVDCFYIGGTKVGALCGEAVVFPKGDEPAHFFSSIKQHGALFAKGRLNGVQFDALFTDNLYFEISKNAIEKAEGLKDILHKKGYRFFLETPTNQQFVIVDNKKMKELEKVVRFGFWEKYDEDHTVIRFCTSWATKDEDIKALSTVL